MFMYYENICQRTYYVTVFETQFEGTNKKNKTKTYFF